MKTFWNLAFGVAVSAGVLYIFFQVFGAFGLVYGMPVLAICVMPMLDLIAAFPRLAVRIAMRRYDGRYYAFRGRHVDIDIDARATCWISTVDVRKTIPSLPSEAVLARLHPGLVTETGDPLVWRITLEALKLVLAKSSDADVGKFLHWLETQVAQPARKRLERGMAIR
jgi:hypothetical protein